MNQQNFVKDLVPFDLGLNYKKNLATKVDPNGYRIVSVRLRDAEFAAFSDQARALGLTNNMALRIAARRIAGFIEIDAETRKSLTEISQNIYGISDSLSQLNAMAMRDRKVDMGVFQKLRGAFAAEYSRLDGFIRILLNVSLRRQDGRSLLHKAAATTVLD